MNRKATLLFDTCLSISRATRPVKFSRQSSSFSAEYVPCVFTDNEADKLLKQTVAPLKHLPYEDQLKLKERYARLSLEKISNILKNNTRKWSVTKLFQTQLDLYGSVACNVIQIVPSPVIDGYRNKSTLVTGLGLDGVSSVVGYYCFPNHTSYKHPEVPVIGGDSVIEDSLHAEIKKAFEVFLKQSKFPALGHRLVEGGHWKSLMIRTNQDKEVMVQASFHPIGATQVMIQEAKDEIKEFFIHREGQYFDIKSLFFQECPYMTCMNSRVPHELLHGDPFIYEQLKGHRFRISPDSFFQANTKGAEVLYDTIGELAGVNKDTVLLDLCCGTGTIGISLAGKVNYVYGIEAVEQAAEDAIHNADINDVQNYHIDQGNTASKLKGLAKHLSPIQEVVAVINPNRSGVGSSTIRAIRNCASIKKVVYVSCKATGKTTKNFVDLCIQSQGKTVGPPFVITNAVPVDMFPHTKHLELCLLFQR